MGRRTRLIVKPAGRGPAQGWRYLACIAEGSQHTTFGGLCRTPEAAHDAARVAIVRFATAKGWALADIQGTDARRSAR